jgi:predicted DNA repair protein MutK
MSTGLIGLLDDVVALAKVAAASLDDVVGQAARAGTKAAGVVIDDAAVTPRYVIGFAAARELPIVRRIAIGSLKNKLLFLLPAALVLSTFLPSAITPLLMIGGAILCYEGAEKVYETFFPHQAQHHEAQLPPITADPATLENQKVASAIKTDFVLSAEIMAIALAPVTKLGLFSRAAVLAVVAVGITALVYGAVALLVKADDAGLAMSRNNWTSAGGQLIRATGRAIVLGMPYLLKGLSVVGTAAMIWVGGGIILHGLESYSLDALPHAVEVLSQRAAEQLPAVAGAVTWLVHALASGLLGLLIGAILIPAVQFAIAPAWQWARPKLRIQ